MAPSGVRVHCLTSMLRLLFQFLLLVLHIINHTLICLGEIYTKLSSSTTFYEILLLKYSFFSPQFEFLSFSTFEESCSFILLVLLKLLNCLFK